MSITDWPEQERPREKLLSRGAAALSDAELLAIFLRTGTKGVTAVDLSRLLLKQFGSLNTLMHASQDDFCQGHGLGNAKYVQLQAVLEMSRRYLQETISNQHSINNIEDTKKYLSSKLAHQQREIFACLYLDNKHHVIAYEELFFGTIDGASVHPREVAKSTLQHNAAAVIFAHNHPSGNSQPSQSDINITQQLTSALNLIDVRVLDHLIIGKGSATSLAELGHL
ncbi:MAG TPA: JAB domain-containing protein [Cycloclasticus sp.]|nr:JAB domain-containing protein [Cycloclasticus sp.]HIL92280.1 JAB domain-containing protein [Cycloclasticus sp.]